jgi:FKBP-type peptidyl-prolyl cis-trans isomerase 2
MNSTNLKTIWKSLDTPFIEDWVGKKIEVTVQKVKAFGEVHDALRVVKTSLELTPKHPKWNGAKEAIKSGTVKIDQIKKQYTISPENETLLCN